MGRVTQAHQRGAHDKMTIDVDFFCLYARLVKHLYPAPRQMRIRQENGAVVGGSARRDRPPIRTPARVLLAPFEIAIYGAERPLQNHGAPDGNTVPGFKLKRVLRRAFRVICHIGIDPRRKRIANHADACRAFRIRALGYFRILEQPVDVILLNMPFTEDLRHPPEGRARILENILKPVLCLRISKGIHRCFERIRVDVRYAPFRAVHNGLCGGRRRFRSGSSR